MSTERTNEELARERAEWLHRHNAPKDWIVMTAQEVAELKAALTTATAERDREIAALVKAARAICDDLITERDGVAGDPLAINHDALRFDHIESLHAALRKAHD
jgi:hypothetical protein